ncbi:acetyltransferase [Penaeicola halotolerans]|uniref:acetyltransferase n=1 Tax=Penaeicola halotolerans TaxID=2793196 RepID=UPI00293D754E|nr:acetyltransferase [Penaeicola halotolerans]
MMYIYGASGHAKVIIDILFTQNEGIRGIFDKNPEIKDILGLPVLGPLEDDFDFDAPTIIAIGSNIIRKNIAEKLASRTEFGNAVHHSAIISDMVSIEEGTVVMHGAILQANTFIGAHVIINTAASVDHDCDIENFAHIAPHSTLCGGVSIGEGTLVGAGATIIPGVKVGNWCTIGAGAVITKDVPDGATVVGFDRVIKR